MSGGSASRAAPLRPRDPRELGSYALEGRLGEGGMGFVYLGRSSAGRAVAIKVIRSEYADDPEFRARFRSEVERAQQVPSYCTAEVLDADPDHDPPYLVVEFVDGPSLAEVVRDRGPLSPGNLHGLAIGVAAALSAIHGAGVIHRDLKPSNVLLAPGTPKVIDFGIARPVDAATGYTRSDQIMGTVAYMSPERFGPGGGRSLTPAADVFAWGAVVAFAGSGRVPFDADSLHAMAYRIMTDPPDLHGLTAPLRALVEQALEKDPTRRPTARELLDRLTAGGASAPTVPVPGPGTAPRMVPPPPSSSGGPRTVAAPTRSGLPDPTPATEPVGRQSRRRGILAGLAALVVLIGTTAGVLAGVLVDGEPGQGASVASTATPTATGGRTDAPTADPSATPTADPAGTPTAGPTATPDAAEPEPIKMFDESLSKPSAWQASDDPSSMAACAFDDGLVVTSQKATLYKCRGPKEMIAYTAVYVNVTLLEPGTCAAVWFRFTVATGGYAVQVCEEAFYLVRHSKDGTVATLRTLSLADPLVVGESVRLGVVMEGTGITVYRGKKVLGEWTNSQFTQGQVVLGLLQRAGTDQPPFRASFTDVEVWGVPAA